MYLDIIFTYFAALYVNSKEIGMSGSIFFYLIYFSQGNMRYAKLISFIDCVTKGYLGDDIAMEFPQTSIPPAHALGPEFDLNHLYSLICAEIPDDCGYWVIFDDLSIALALGIADSSSLTRFLIKLRVKLEQTFGSLLILIHKDLLKAEPELEYLVNNVLLKSEFVVETSGLQSGFSKDIDGHVSIYRGYLASVSHESRMKFADFQPQALHYKIYDSDVRIIGKGLSQGFV